MKKIKELGVGQVFKYKNLKWIKIDNAVNGVFAITSDEFPGEGKFDRDTNDWRESIFENWPNKGHISAIIDGEAEEEDFLEDKEVEEKTLTEKIRQWFRDRNLDSADPKAQALKLMEEVGELAEGLAKDKPEQVKDSIGDIYVILTGLSIQLDYNIEECIEVAYEEIKDRKGKMIDGVFVKESDL